MVCFSEIPVSNELFGPDVTLALGLTLVAVPHVNGGPIPENTRKYVIVLRKIL